MSFLIITQAYVQYKYCESIKCYTHRNMNTACWPFVFRPMRVKRTAGLRDMHYKGFKGFKGALCKKLEQFACIIHFWPNMSG